MTDDRIYLDRHNPLSPFEFNDKVAAVFPDMAQRSIPGYSQVLNLLLSIVPKLIDLNKKHICYDLGCSLGAVSFSLASISDNLTIIAIDNSQAMINRLNLSLEQSQATNIEPRCANICLEKLEPCSLVLLHYTLQFIDSANKQNLIESIYKSLLPSGWLLLSEKILPRDLPEMTDWHEQFKLNRGYSKLEINQKRQALEKVMQPETIDSHYTRLKTAGFTRIGCWYKALNFISLAAQK